MTKAKGRKTKKTKQLDLPAEAPQQVKQPPSQPTSTLVPKPKRSLLPHNMTHEINLLKDRVSSLENMVQSLLSGSTKSSE